MSAREEARKVYPSRGPEPITVQIVSKQRAAFEAGAAWQAEQLAQEIEAAYLGPDSGRNPITGADPSDANERHAYDEGLEQAARIARGQA